MAPCEVEFRLQGREEWVRLRQLNSGEAPGSFTDVSKGGREVYLFECSPDDSFTIIYRSKSGIDYDLGTRGEERVVVPTEKPEVVKVLSKGESYEIEVTTERGRTGTFRFAHK
ncbi:MAG: hypothetical protein ACOYT7_03195 [Patescibacteria group bacterium]